MAKFSVDEIKNVLEASELDIDPRLIDQIVEELKKKVEAEEEEKVSEPTIKKQYVVLLNDDFGEFAKKVFTGWVVQIPEVEDVHTTGERIKQAAFEYNTSKRGRREPVKDIANACERVPAKWLKQQLAWVRTKEQITILPTKIEPFAPEKTDKKVDHRRRGGD